MLRFVQFSFLLLILMILGFISSQAQNKSTKGCKAKLIFNKGELTTSDIAQKRDLTLYKNGGHFDCRTWAETQQGSCDLSKLLEFVWQHWENKQRAYIRITGDSVDAVSTSHIFIEPSQDKTWHIAWRIVRHYGEITDIRDIKSIKKRVAATPYDCWVDCKKDTIVLSCIDWEGKEIEVL